VIGRPAKRLSSPVHVAVLDTALELDFGAYGIGETSVSNNTTAADGYYELDVLLPKSPTAVHHFFRWDRAAPTAGHLRSSTAKSA
jgi:hypothetical protein